MVKFYRYNAFKSLYRHGAPKTERYIWYSPKHSVAVLYGKKKYLRTPNLTNNQVNNFFRSKRGSNVLSRIENNIRSRTKTPQRNLKLLNLRNRQTMMYLLNQLKPNLKSALLNKYVKYNGNTASRPSNFNKNTILGDLITTLRNDSKLGQFNGFYNKSKNLHEEVVLFNNTTPRRLTNVRKFKTNIIKNGGANSFTNWLAARQPPRQPQTNQNSTSGHKRKRNNSQNKPIPLKGMKFVFKL